MLQTITVQCCKNRAQTHLQIFQSRDPPEGRNPGFENNALDYTYLFILPLIKCEELNVL